MEYYLGSEYKSNYVWGVAMNLAWHELNESILHGKVGLKTDDKVALRMTDQLNAAPFTKNDLDEKSYYIKSGYGQKTVDIMNKESRAKFPEKSFEDLKLNLGSRDIIAYAYFLKKVEYLTQFREKKVLFEKETVNGFYADTTQQKNNVGILRYWDDDKFIIRLTLKDDGDELILAKGFDMNNPKDALNEINKYNKDAPPPIDGGDQFEMPKLHLDHHRDYIQLMGKSLANKGFEEYFIAQMFENIKFDMDHKGARVESAAVIAAPTAMPSSQRPKIRRFILDKPFWVVMKRKNSQHPYFVLSVKNTELMEIKLPATDKKEMHSIGSARMEGDGTLILQLRAQAPGGTTGDALLRYSPGHPEYNRILQHLGGLAKGQEKPIPPWPGDEK